jgi:hypothetical protein
MEWLASRGNSGLGLPGERFMPRFVILEHDYPHLHWDLLLETGEVLRSWRLMSCPLHGESLIAVALADHRLCYLDYEGPISGNRGTVRRWEKGTFATRMDEQDHIDIRLDGEHLHGRLQLHREQADRWCGVFVEEPSAGEAGQGSE